MGAETPAMDLEYLIHDVMTLQAPLDWHGVLRRCGAAPRLGSLS
jgi:hypothetical protein